MIEIRCQIWPCGGECFLLFFFEAAFDSGGGEKLLHLIGERKLCHSVTSKSSAPEKATGIKILNHLNKYKLEKYYFE